MKKALAISLFVLTGTLFTAEHDVNNGVSRKKNEIKRNDKYFDLCGKGKALSTVAPAKLDSKTLAAYDLLRAKCASCHNPASTSGAKSFSDILDTQDLISHGTLKAGNAEASTLIDRVEDGSMPLGSKELSADEKKVLKDWIASGAQSFSASSSAIPEVGFISTDDLEACMLQDLRNVNEEDQPFTRYLNLGNLYNSGRREELEQNRLALNKLLNSLSWKKDIKNPTVIDGTGTLLKFDLRDYKWTPEMWERIVKRNPYPEPIDSAKEKELVTKTKTQTPFLRGDWFVFTIFNKKDPNNLDEEYLYHTLLYDLPKLAVNVGKKDTDKSLEKLLSVDVKENEENGDMTRAGFRQSNVTKSNRIVDRHETPFGAYWKSSDFKTRVDKQNIFQHPLDFERNGGEYIYSLPNKLHGYLLSDAKGTRLDGAPLDIVADPARFHKDGVVLNGISCMNCHTKGIKKHDDEVLPHFQNIEKLLEKNPNRNPKFIELIQGVKKLYKGNAVLNSNYNEDEKAYSEAIKKTQNSTENPDPVFATSRQFEAPLDIRAMAAELGHDTKEVKDLIYNNLDLTHLLALGSQHTVERDTFNEHFTLLSNLLNGNNGGALVSDLNFDKHFEFVKILPGVFYMGSNPLEEGRDSDETQHRVRITKTYEIGKFEVTQSLWEKVMGKKNNPRFLGANRPIESVSWEDIKKEDGFLARLNKLRKSQGDACTYRLPTEAEWEFAARGGTVTKYSFGDNENQAAKFAWFIRNSFQQTHDVDDSTKGANPNGLQGMHGNVREWCQDTYEAELGSKQQTDPKIGSDNDDGSLRVIRGGGLDDGERELRSAFRIRGNASVRNFDVGFRLVRTCPAANEKLNSQIESQ